MANRVNASEVREIIDIDSSILDISSFILAANLLITKIFSGDTTTSAAELKELERWLSAHLISCLDPQTTEEWNEEVRVKYSGTFGKGLESTRYGQTVLMLDTTGKMATLGRKKASFGMVDYSTSL